ncbi:MAG: sugar transferase [Anaerolineae bacterium]|nr:sugar transferase [Anaerolineae bacterium]
MTAYQGITTRENNAAYLAAKRLLDIVVASILLILFAPLMLVIACAIALDSQGPIVFRQQRVRGEQPLGEPNPDEQQFTFLKFRTMYADADQAVHQHYVTELINGAAKRMGEGEQKLFKLNGDRRVTRVGRFLRKMSLDELPQLFNVLRGEMSLVGPRPAIPYEVRQYKRWHLRRLSVQQGLTGLWQVMGRNELSFDEMVQLDIEYAQRQSLWLDIKILLQTVPAVLRTRGVC